MGKNNSALLLQSRAVDLDARSDAFNVLQLLILVTLLPTSVFYIFATSSQASGVMLTSAIVIIQAMLGIIRHPTSRQVFGALTIIALICIGILSHALVAYYFQSLSFVRIVQSLALFAFMMFGAYLLRFAIFDNQHQSIDKAATALFLIFMLVGIAGSLGIRPIELAAAYNPVFPFGEPSHYALTFTPILLFVCVRYKIAFRLAALFSALVIAYLLESLSLVAAVVLVGLITLPIAFLVLAAVGFSVAVGILDVTYFTDRLDLNYESRNLSVLVYLQGWELMADSMRRTLGWGLGFQQLGFGPISSPTADAILRLVGNDANLKDGSFTLAKAASEFGILGFAGFSLFAFMAARSAWMLREAALARASITAPLMLAMSVISGYIVEAFLRGIGYFSGSTMMLMAAVLYMSASEGAHIEAKS